VPKLREHPDHDIMGARMKVAQELLRNADIQTTMNVYTGAMEKDKREAANRVAHAVLWPGAMMAACCYRTQTNPNPFR
jgi:hypothetical protein